MEFFIIERHSLTIFVKMKCLKWTKMNDNFPSFPLMYEISYVTHVVQSALPTWALANIVPLWTCNWEGIWLVSIHKWPFATISTSIFGISCAAYVKYASAQSLGFLDLAANCSFINWKLQLAPSGVSGWTLVSFLTDRNMEPGRRSASGDVFAQILADGMLNRRISKWPPFISVVSAGGGFDIRYSIRL